jgi:hypothetical protein
MNNSLEETKQRFIDQLRTIDLIGSDTKPIRDFYADPDNITGDMFDLGIINSPLLIINLPDVIHFDINLRFSLQQSIKQRKFKFIELLIERNINLLELEPTFMPVCASLLCQSDNPETDPLNDLFYRLIDLKIPINSNNYACLYILANSGRLDLIEKIIRIYSLINNSEIIHKVCASAIRNDHVDIIEFFIPISIFVTIPDIIFLYCTKAIEYGDNVKVIKYLTSECVQIAQEDYQLVKRARQLNRKQILQYFEESDPVSKNK